MILATGIGKPTFFLSSQDELRRNLASAASVSETNPPPIMGFGEFVSRVNNDLKSKRNPMAPYANKKILVVGAGDSGKVVLEWLAGLGPSTKSYITAQGGEPKEIVWAGVDIFTCKEFLAGARARYARLAQSLNSSLISLAPVRINRIEGRGKRISVRDADLKTQGDGSFGPDGLSEEDRAKVTELANRKVFFTSRGITVGDLRNKDQTNADGTVNLRITQRSDEEFDYMIDATGFRTEVLGLLKAGFPAGAFDSVKELSSIFDPSTGVLGDNANDQLRGKKRDIAGVLKIPDTRKFYPIFTVGPANEQIFKGGLVDESETANVSANTVSLFANIIRTQRLAEILAKEESKYPKEGFARDKTSRGLLTLAAGTKTSPEVIFDLKDFPSSRGSYVRFADKDDLEIGMRKVLSSIKFAGATEDFKIWIFLDQRNSRRASSEQKRVTLRIEPGFQDEEDRNLLIQAISQDLPFQDLLFKLFPADPVSPSGPKVAETFDKYSQVVFFIDNYAAGTPGESATKIRVRADATPKDLQNATRIDLAAASNFAITPEPEEKSINSTLIRILTQRRPLAVGCLVYQKVDGKLGIKGDPNQRQISVRLRPVGTPPSPYYRIAAEFDVVRADFPPASDLDGAVNYVRGRNFPVATSTIQSVYGLSVPVTLEETKRDVGSIVENYVPQYYTSDADRPSQSLIAYLAGSPTIGNDEIATIRPSSSPNALFLDIGAETYTLVCKVL